jgi:hypothetical protein
MPAILTNNCSSSLASSISVIATSLSVAAGDGLKFPELSSGDWFHATITKLVAGSPVWEIVKVTARTGDILTIVRAQEGTTALSFSAGDKIDVRLTAGLFNSKMDKTGGKFAGPVDMDDQPLTGAVLADCGDRVKTVDAGVDTLDYRDGRYQVWAPSPGAHTLVITNWPPAGVHGELWIEGVNLGQCTITTAVALDYLKSDGTYATTTSLNANQGATLQSVGIDNVLIWGRNGAPKRAKVAR